jgi:hypothetical protein
VRWLGAVVGAVSWEMFCRDDRRLSKRSSPWRRDFAIQMSRLSVLRRMW